MEKEKKGYVKKVMASLCHHCPLCRYGRKAPESLIGRMLHHRLHADHCPFWKAEKEITDREGVGL